MKNFIKFHCDINTAFSSAEQKIRTFMYYGYEIESHTHDFYEINIVMGGSGNHIIGNNSIEVKKGDVFAIPPKIIHSYRDCEGLNVYHLIFRPEFIDGLLKNEKTEGLQMFLEIEPLLRQGISNNLFLSLSSKELMAIKNDLDAISEEKEGDYPTGDYFKNHTAQKLIHWFAWLMVKQGNKKDSPVDADTELAITKIINYIYEEYSHKITIDTLCRISNMSRATLFRSFKAYCGCSPMQFIQSYRKKQALNFMAEQKNSKTFIAQECGFYDLSHMERYIKNSN